jgi:hypothetical protein
MAMTSRVPAEGAANLAGLSDGELRQRLTELQEKVFRQLLVAQIAGIRREMRELREVHRNPGALAKALSDLLRMQGPDWIVPAEDDSDLAAIADLPRRATAAVAEIKALIELADRLAEAGYLVAGALSADLSAGQAFDPDDYVRNVTETAEAVAAYAQRAQRESI